MDYTFVTHFIPLTLTTSSLENTILLLTASFQLKITIIGLEILFTHVNVLHKCIKYLFPNYFHE